MKLGLAISEVPMGDPVAFEQRDRILELDTIGRIQHRASLFRGLARAFSARAVRNLGLRARGGARHLPHVVEYESAPGEPMRAILDTWPDRVFFGHPIFSPENHRTSGRDRYHDNNTARTETGQTRDEHG